MVRICLCLIALLSGCGWLSSEYPQFDMPIISLSLAEEDYDNLFKSSYFDEWTSVSVENETTSFRAKLRLFGHLSRQAPKKSFKIVPEDGTGSIILSSQYVDKSLCRYKLANYLYKKAGFDTPNLEYRVLYINGVFQGLYLKRENVDSSFFIKRDLEIGSTYKLNLNGSFSSKTGMTIQQNFRKTLPKKDQSFYDISELVSYLDEGDITTEGLSEWLDIPNVINYLAVSKLVTHNDGYRNNIVIYFNPTIQKFQIIPWDLDATFVSAPCFSVPIHNGLFEKVEAIEEYRLMIRSRMSTLFDKSDLLLMLDTYKQEVETTYKRDPFLQHESLSEEVEHITLYLERVSKLLK